MDSKRQLKVARMIQKELGTLFQQDAKSIFGNAFISVTHVTISPDLGVAKAFLSFMLTPDKNALLKDIQDKSKIIRQMLGQKIRNQVRVIPELVFYLDDSAEYAVKMNSILDKLDIPKQDNGESKQE